MPTSPAGHNSGAEVTRAPRSYDSPKERPRSAEASEIRQLFSMAVGNAGAYTTNTGKAALSGQAVLSRLRHGPRRGGSDLGTGERGGSAARAGAGRRRQSAGRRTMGSAAVQTSASGLRTTVANTALLDEEQRTAVLSILQQHDPLMLSQALDQALIFVAEDLN